MLRSMAVLLAISFAWVDFAQEGVRVLIEIELGEIVVEVDREHAPVTADNFLAYVDAGFYVVGQFHRTVTMDNQPDDDVKIEVI
jgi:peptidyl-prolyl cis-trans isomerase A (cyclophilin A)